MEERPCNGDRGVDGVQVDEKDAGSNDPRVSLVKIDVARLSDDPEELWEKDDPVDRIDAAKALPGEGRDGVGVADVVPMSGEDDDAAKDEEKLDAQAAFVETKRACQQRRVMNYDENRCEATTGLKR